jgi:hypothetical protein
MCKSKWASLAVGAIVLAAVGAGIQSLAEDPPSGEKSLVRDGGPPPGDDRGPPRDRGPREFGPPRGEFQPGDRGPRAERREDRGPDNRRRDEDGRPGNAGDRPRGAPRPELGMVMPPFVRGQLKLTEEQQKQIDELQKEVQGKLKSILSADQVRRAEEAMQQGPPRPNEPGGESLGRGLDERRFRGPEDRRFEGRGQDFRGPGPGDRDDRPRRFDGPPPRDDGPAEFREGRRPPEDDRRNGPPPRDGRKPPEDDRRGDHRDGDRRSEAPKTSVEQPAA